MAGNGAHDIVGDTGGDGAADPGGVGEERVETAVASLESVSCAHVWFAGSTHIVQINVNTAEVVQHEVSDCVGALDRVRVAVEGLQEPRVLVGNELAGLLIGPELAASAVS